MRIFLLAALVAAIGATPASGHLKVNRFDAPAAMRWTRIQVKYGPRPAGSPALRALGDRLRAALPHGHFEAVPGGLRNVIGVVPGRDRHDVVVVGAHYDTKDIPGFVGANDGAAGTGVAVQLARSLKPHMLHATLVFILFGGEEAPAGVPDSEFLQQGIRGSKVAAQAYKNASAMILLDFVGIKNLSIPRDGGSDPVLWAKLRAAAARVGAASAFPPETRPTVYDDDTPFSEVGVPSIDLIDFDYGCFHQLCDNLSQVSLTSLDESGETVRALLPRL